MKIEGFETYCMSSRLIRFDLTKGITQIVYFKFFLHRWYITDYQCDKYVILLDKYELLL